MKVGAILVRLVGERTFWPAERRCRPNNNNTTLSSPSANGGRARPVHPPDKQTNNSGSTDPRQLYNTQKSNTHRRGLNFLHFMETHTHRHKQHNSDNNKMSLAQISESVRFLGSQQIGIVVEEITEHRLQADNNNSNIRTNNSGNEGGTIHKSPQV